MLLFMMVSMITPLGSTMINVALCAAGGALFAFGLGAISQVVLKKTGLYKNWLTGSFPSAVLHIND